MYNTGTYKLYEKKKIQKSCGGSEMAKWSPMGPFAASRVVLFTTYNYGLHLLLCIGYLRDARTVGIL